MFTMDRRQFFIFVFCRPAAYFLSVLINEPHRLWRDLSYGAADQNRLRLRMLEAIEAPDSGMSKATKITDMRLRRPKRESFKDFGRARSAPGPDILDKAASGSNLHGLLSLFRPQLIGKGPKSRVAKQKIPKLNCACTCERAAAEMHHKRGILAPLLGPSFVSRSRGRRPPPRPCSYRRAFLTLP